jgi:hypothetical protein
MAKTDTAHGMMSTRSQLLWEAEAKVLLAEELSGPSRYTRAALMNLEKARRRETAKETRSGRTALHD